MTEPELEPLKLCSHCGNIASVFIDNIYCRSESYQTVCRTPFCVVMGPFKTSEEATAAWNKRVFEPTSPFGSDKL